MATSSSTLPFSEVFTPWLLEVDPSGRLLNYTAALESTYDTVSQIVKLYYKEDNHYEMFYDDLGVKDPEDQRLFLAWFATTAAKSEGATSSLRPPLEPQRELEVTEGGPESPRVQHSSTNGEEAKGKRAPHNSSDARPRSAIP